MKIELITTLVLRDQPQGYILSYFYRLVRASSLSLFLSRLYIPTLLGKVSNLCSFDSWKMHLWVKNLNSAILICATCKTLPKVLIITQAVGNYSSPKPFFLKIHSPSKQKGSGEESTEQNTTTTVRFIISSYIQQKKAKVFWKL